MAKEQALQFIARVNDDSTLQNRLQSVTKEGIGGIVKVGKEVGFDFNTEEFESVVLEQWGSHRSENIAEDELESIAGGGDLAWKFANAQKFFVNASAACATAACAIKW